MVNAHAGFEADELNIVVFDTEAQLENILKQTGLKVDENKHVIDPKGEVIKCSSCNEEVTLEHLGHVLPGSYYVYCRNPICIMDYIERFG